MKKVVLTGGGTAGHVTANVALIPKLIETGWRVEYIGSVDGIERKIITEHGSAVPYHTIQTGKLRRYFDLKNFKDPFKVIQGVMQSWRLLRTIKPDIIFSKGGFVSVPVVLAGWLLRIPVIIHESDMTPGLANKIAIPLATKVCVTFPETMRHISPQKSVLTGSPIRPVILKGSADHGRKLCGFYKDKPVLLVMGGSLGSRAINLALRQQLSSLLERFQIIHICGSGNLDDSLTNYNHYKQFEYMNDELADVLAMADLIVSRAGSNSIFEFLALKKPMLLIPLTKSASRGDQILNARSFEQRGLCKILYEEELTASSLHQSIEQLYDARNEYISRMGPNKTLSSLDTIIDWIERTASVT